MTTIGKAALLCGLAAAPGFAAGTEVDDALDRIVRRFARVAAPAAAVPAELSTAAAPGVSTPAVTAPAPVVEEAAPVLALLPLSSDKLLERQNVDFAVGELLTQRLLRSGKFELVNAARLKKSLRQHKGELDAAAAAQAGQDAGAKYAVLGDVRRRGKSYQVAVRLLDTANARSLSSEIVELPAEAFEEEASGYVKAVPQRRWGFYLGAGFAPGLKTQQPPPQTFSGSYKGTAWGVNFNPSGGGRRREVAGGPELGLRYSPRTWLMFDLSASFLDLGGGSDSGDQISYVGGQTCPVGCSNTYALGGGNFEAFGGKFSVNYVQPLSRHSRAWLGLGMMAVGLGGADHGGFRPCQNYGSGSNSYQVCVDSHGTDPHSLGSPFARLGLELKGSRFGWALLGQLNLAKKTIARETEVQVQDTNTSCNPGQPCNNPTVQSYRAVGRSVEFPQLILGTTFSIYF